MKKKDLIKKIVGICLVAMMAVAGVGKYAKANSNSLEILDSNGVMHKIRAYSTIGRMNGSASTEAVNSSSCYCTVSASFYWYGADDNYYDEDDKLLYTNGRGAGGMHGAGVSVNYAKVTATHTMRITTGGDGSCTTNDAW